MKGVSDSGAIGAALARRHTHPGVQALQRRLALLVIGVVAVLQRQPRVGLVNLGRKLVLDVLQRQVLPDRLHLVGAPLVIALRLRADVAQHISRYGTTRVCERQGLAHLPLRSDVIQGLA